MEQGYIINFSDLGLLEWAPSRFIVYFYSRCSNLYGQQNTEGKFRAQNNESCECPHRQVGDKVHTLFNSKPVVFQNLRHSHNCRNGWKQNNQLG
jgi:hypothetical protein